MHHNQNKRQRGTEEFTKPPLNKNKQIKLLLERGLNIQNIGKAKQYLEHIGYYRLSAYTKPFMDPTTDRFISGTTLTNILELYKFDRQLRLLIIDSIERIEVAFRAALVNHMCETHNDPFWYTDERYYNPSRKNGNKQTPHREVCDYVRNTCATIMKVEENETEHTTIRKSSIEHFLSKYSKPELPPAWMVAELLTFGHLNNLFMGLKKDDQKKISQRAFNGVLDSSTLIKNLKAYKNIRNICAHHGRLWNSDLKENGHDIGVLIPSQFKDDLTWPNTEDLHSDDFLYGVYPVLVSLQILLIEIAPHSSWATRLHDLLSKQQEFVLDGIGAPKDWHHDPFWEDHIYQSDF